MGAPDLIEASIGVRYSLKGVPEDEKPHFTAWWDMHAFGITCLIWHHLPNMALT